MNRLRGFLVLCRLQALGHWRNRQALAYSLGVPIVFLLGFGAVFRASEPRLLAEMGSLVTITVLGGACFGFPVTLVSERQAGVWRRHRLVPVSRIWLLGPVVAVRCGIIALSVGVLLAVAFLGFGTPPPVDWLGFALALAWVTLSFLGLGLLLAAVSDSVPAVQAIGQCIFLPMILIGGVGVPLEALPRWAQTVSAFLPGRYAVEILQAAWEGQWLRGALMPWGALLVMGAGGAAVGLSLFRWQPQGKAPVRSRALALVALLPWLAVGLGSAASGRWKPETRMLLPSQITEAHVQQALSILVPPDDSLVTPVWGEDHATSPRVQQLRTAFSQWPALNGLREPEQVRMLLGAAATADAAQDVLERDLALAVFLELEARYPRELRRLLLAWVALTPDQGPSPVDASFLGVRRKATEALVRERVTLYAVKALLRTERP